MKLTGKAVKKCKNHLHHHQNFIFLPAWERGLEKEMSAQKPGITYIPF